MSTVLRQATDGPAGPPLVLVNGLGASLRSWNRLVETLGPRVTTLRFEHPDRVGEVPTVRDHADAVAAAMDGAGLDTAVIVGWSFGGLVAQEFARRHRERTAGIGLVSTSAGVGSLPPTTWGAGEVVGIEMMRNAKVSPAGSAQRLTGVVGRSLAVMRWSSLGWLHSIDVPSVVVHGWFDHVVPVANGLVVASRLPGAELELRLDGGHYLPHRRPRWMAPILHRLVERAARPSEVTSQTSA